MTTRYEKFIALNQQLMDCYKTVSAPTFSAMSTQQQEQVCKAEREAVRASILNGDASFRSILEERIASLESQTQ
jgi:hypothetical protein